jgi:hypothetical protein
MDRIVGNWVDNEGNVYCFNHGIKGLIGEV